MHHNFITDPILVADGTEFHLRETVEDGRRYLHLPVRDLVDGLIVPALEHIEAYKDVGHCISSVIFFVWEPNEKRKALPETFINGQGKEVSNEKDIAYITLEGLSKMEYILCDSLCRGGGYMKFASVDEAHSFIEYIRKLGFLVTDDKMWREEITGSVLNPRKDVWLTKFTQNILANSLGWVRTGPF